MVRRKPYIHEPVERYGFRFGPMVVSRAFEDEGSVCVLIQTKTQELTIYASAKGRSLRVSRDGKELR